MPDVRAALRHIAPLLTWADTHLAMLASVLYAASFLLPVASQDNGTRFSGIGVALSVLRDRQTIPLLVVLFLHAATIFGLLATRRYRTLPLAARISAIAAVALCLAMAVFMWIAFPFGLYVGFYAWFGCVALVALALWRGISRSERASDSEAAGIAHWSVRNAAPVALAVIGLALPVVRGASFAIRGGQGRPAASRSALSKYAANTPSRRAGGPTQKTAAGSPSEMRPTPPPQASTQPPSPGNNSRESHPVPDWFQPSAATPANEAVDVLLGKTSYTYNEHGFKDVTLGDSFDEISRSTPLRVNPYGPAYVYRDAAGGGYVFTQEGTLVCHSRSYNGGTEDYLDSLKDLFGTTDHPIITRKQVMNASAVRRTYIRYTFPKTLVLIEFASGIALTGGQARQTEGTHVFVLDREWAEDLLKRSGDAKEVCLQWMRQASQQVQIGVLEPESLRQLPDTRIRKVRDGQIVRYIDEKQEKHYGSQGHGGDSLEQLATVASYTAPSERSRGTVTFSFARYSGCQIDSLLKQEDNESTRKAGPAYAVSETPFLTFLETELNSILMQEMFPPRTDEIRFMQRERAEGTIGAGWYEWNHSPDRNNAWTVRCGLGGAMELEYLGDRGL